MNRSIKAILTLSRYTLKWQSSRLDKERHLVYYITLRSMEF